MFVFGFFGAQISMAIGMFAFGFGLLLLTWQTRMRGAFRALIYFIALLPVLYWFDKAARVLFPPPPPAHGPRGTTDPPIPTSELIFRFGFAAVAVVGLLIVVRHRGAGRMRVTSGQSGGNSRVQSKWSNVPTETFRDVGGMQEEKRRIAAVVNNRLHPERSAKHGVVQNGILLYGPRGTGKTFIARATAGEFKINFWPISPNRLIESRIGSSEANIRDAFDRAYLNRPILLFIDEIDSIGTAATWKS